MSLWDLIYSQDSNVGEKHDNLEYNSYQSDTKSVNSSHDDVSINEDNDSTFPLDSDQSFSTSSGIDSEIQGFNRMHGKRNNIHIYGDKPALGNYATNLEVYNNSPEVSYLIRSSNETIPKVFKFCSSFIWQRHYILNNQKMEIQDTIPVHFIMPQDLLPIFYFHNVLYVPIFLTDQL